MAVLQRVAADQDDGLEPLATRIEAIVLSTSTFCTRPHAGWQDRLSGRDVAPSTATPRRRSNRPATGRLHRDLVDLAVEAERNIAQEGTLDSRAKCAQIRRRRR